MIIAITFISTFYFFLVFVYRVISPPDFISNFGKSIGIIQQPSNTSNLSNFTKSDIGTLDFTPPTVSKVEPDKAIVNNQTIFQVIAFDDSKSILCNFYWDDVSIGKMESSNNVFTKAYTPKAIGEHLAYAYCTDKYGNYAQNNTIIKVSTSQQPLKFFFH